MAAACPLVLRLASPGHPACPSLPVLLRSSLLARPLCAAADPSGDTVRPEIVASVTKRVAAAKVAVKPLEAAPDASVMIKTLTVPRGLFGATTFRTTLGGLQAIDSRIVSHDKQLELLSRQVRCALARGGRICARARAFRAGLHTSPLSRSLARSRLAPRRLRRRTSSSAA